MRLKLKTVIYLTSLSLAGFLLSFSILIDSSRPSGTSELCLSGGTSCSSVINSPFGEFLGLPLSYWGALYFLLLLGVLFLIFQEWIPAKAGDHLLSLIIGGGITTSVILIFAMIFVLKKICGSCLAVHTINILLVLSILKLKSSWFEQD